MNQQTIIKKINSMTQSNLVELNNIYCDTFGLPGSIVYSNNQIFIDSLNYTIDQFNLAVFCGDYKSTDNWVTFDGYNNLQSYSTFTTNELIDTVETIAFCIAQNFYKFEHLFLNY